LAGIIGAIRKDIRVETPANVANGIYYKSFSSNSVAQSKGLVKFSSGHIINCVDNDTKCSGFLIHNLTTDNARGTCCVAPGMFVEMKIKSGETFSDADIGSGFGIHDHETIDPSDTTNKIFVLQSYDNSADYCVGSIYPSAMEPA